LDEGNLETLFLRFDQIKKLRKEQVGIVIRQSIKGTVVTFLGSFLGYINLLYLFPLILSPEQIGLYKVLMDAATFCVIFALLGSLDTSIKFFPIFKDEEKQHNGFLFYILTIALTGFLLFTGVFIFMNEALLDIFRDKSPLFIKYSNYLVPLVLLLLLFDVFANYTRSLYRIVIPKFFKEVMVRAIIGISVLLLMADIYDITGFVLSLSVAYAVALIFLIGYIKRLGHLFLKPNFHVFRSDQLKELSTFGIFSILGSGSGVIVSKIDSLMIASMAGLVDTAVYGIAYSISALIQLPRRTLAEIITPLIAAAFQEGKMEKIQVIYQKSSVTLLIIGGFAFTGIWVNIDSIFSLIPNSEIFIRGKYVVLVIGLTNLFEMSLGANAPIITNSKYYKWNMIFLPSLALMTAISNFLLIPKYGILGAAGATFISITFINIVRFLFVLIKLKLQPFTLDTLKAVMIVIFVFYLSSLIPSFNNIVIDISLRSGAIVVLYLILNLWLKPSEDISKLIERGISVFLGKK